MLESSPKPPPCSTFLLFSSYLKHPPPTATCRLQPPTEGGGTEELPGQQETWIIINNPHSHAWPQLASCEEVPVCPPLPGGQLRPSKSTGASAHPLPGLPTSQGKPHTLLGRQGPVAPAQSVTGQSYSGHHPRSVHTHAELVSPEGCRRIWAVCPEQVSCAQAEPGSPEHITALIEDPTACLSQLCVPVSCL